MPTHRTDTVDPVDPDLYVRSSIVVGCAQMVVLV